MSTESQRKELRHRVEEKKSRLEAELERLKAEGEKTRRDKVEEIETRLDNLSNMLRDGWDRLSEQTAQQLNRWLQ